MTKEEKEMFLRSVNFPEKEDKAKYTEADIKEGIPDHDCSVCLLIKDTKAAYYGKYSQDKGFQRWHVCGGIFHHTTKVENVIGYIEL